MFSYTSFVWDQIREKGTIALQQSIFDYTIHLFKQEYSLRECSVFHNKNALEYSEQAYSK